MKDKKNNEWYMTSGEFAFLSANEEQHQERIRKIDEFLLKNKWLQTRFKASNGGELVRID